MSSTVPNALTLMMGPKLFEPSMASNMLAATNTLQSALDTSLSLPVRLWYSSWWVVGTHLAYLLRSSLRLGSVGTTTFVVSLASGLQRGLDYAIHEKRTNADVTFGSHLRGGLFYSDPVICATATQHAYPLRSQCFASIALQQAISTKPSTLPRRHRRCLNPSLLLLNIMPFPPRRPGRHRLVPAVQHAAHLLL
jgi:hypothetical protein